MNEVQFDMDKSGNGYFHISDGARPVAKMEVGIAGTELTVYHTEVEEDQEGQGYAKQMLTAMVAYARQNHLKVIPLCPYVYLQFKRHEDKYGDVWQRT